VVAEAAKLQLKHQLLKLQLKLQQLSQLQKLLQQLLILLQLHQLLKLHLLLKLLQHLTNSVSLQIKNKPSVEKRMVMFCTSFFVL